MKEKYEVLLPLHVIVYNQSDNASKRIILIGLIYSYKNHMQINLLTSPEFIFMSEWNTVTCNLVFKSIIGYKHLEF